MIEICTVFIKIKCAFNKKTIKQSPLHFVYARRQKNVRYIQMRDVTGGIRKSKKDDNFQINVLHLFPNG